MRMKHIHEAETAHDKNPCITNISECHILMWKSSTWNQQKVTRLQNVKSKLFSLITSYLHSSGWLAGPSEVIVKAFQPEGMCEFNIQVSSMIFRYIRHINKHLILNSTISVIDLQNLHKLQTML